jgi:ferredoxin, 2Fe-2S
MAWLPEPGSMDASMLSFAAAAEPNSRLFCRIVMRDEVEGLMVRMPEGRH